MSVDYVNDLSYEEKIIFLKLFCVLIKIDNKVDGDEITFLKSIAQKYGIDSATTLSIIKNTNAKDYILEAKKITNRNHALELLKELCFLANVDENLHETELEIVIRIADILGIEHEKLLLINRFVLDNIILNKAGQIILEKENGY